MLFPPNPAALGDMTAVGGRSLIPIRILIRVWAPSPPISRSEAMARAYDGRWARFSGKGGGMMSVGMER